MTHLIAGCLCGQGSLFWSARVLAELLSCLSPGCLAVVGELAGGRLLKGGLRAQWGLKLATEERIQRRRLLQSSAKSLMVKPISRHTARKQDCISDSESGPEWPCRRPTAAAPLLSVSLAAASSAWGLEFAGDSGPEPWAGLDASGSGQWARGCCSPSLRAAKEQTVTLKCWLGPGGTGGGT